MKKTIILTIILLTLQACENTCRERQFSIINNTEKDIEIFSYKFNINNRQFFFTKTTTIINNNKYEKTLKACGEEGPITFEDFVEGDSIAIDYGDKVQGYYFTKSNVRNPYYLDILNKSNNFIYTLTPEDYANATPKP